MRMIKQLAALLSLGALVTATACDSSSEPAPTMTPPEPATSVEPLGFAPPFSGKFAVVSVFDHDLPFEFSDTNGFLLSYWGEKMNGIDGHNAYDWLMPTGTPLLASAAGTVIFAGSETPFVCPLLGNSVVTGQYVNIRHTLTNGQVVVTQYLHMSRIDVKAGDAVTVGQQIGLSGSTGCSTTPHLHFAVFRPNSTTGAFVSSDPYGWQASTTDPWSRDARGTTSTAIWTGAHAPELYRELVRGATYPRPSPVAFKTLRYLGVDDAHNPNNEFIEIDVNPDLPSWDFSASTLFNSAGAAYVFPRGFRLTGGSTVRIYSGAGTNTASTLYMGRTSPAWNNTGDCALLYESSLQRVLASAPWANGVCATPTAAHDRFARAGGFGLSPSGRASLISPSLRPRNTRGRAGTMFAGTRSNIQIPNDPATLRTLQTWRPLEQFA
jgi:murein DD-endopeptidase MepM/ murein hydrolase activator NlpD